MQSKAISTLHNDSIPETPSGKSGVDVSTHQSIPWQRQWRRLRGKQGGTVFSKNLGGDRGAIIPPNIYKFTH